MKIAVTSAGPDLTSPFDPRFGRCPYFIIVDPDTMQWQAQANPSAAITGGAGLQAAQFVVGQGAGMVITGQVGPNAVAALRAAGIAAHLCVAGTVGEAIERLQRGELVASSNAAVSDHFGPGVARGDTLGGSGARPGGGSITGAFGRGMGGRRGGGGRGGRESR